MLLSFRFRRGMAIVAAIALSVMLTGCQLPSCTLYTPEDPSASLGQFFDAINRGDDKTADALMINSTWSGRTDASPSASDEALAAALAESRSFVIERQNYPDDSHRTVLITVALTTLDMSLLEKALTESVEADVKERMYEGEEKADIAETQDIINRHLHDLLQSPENYYSTSEQTIEMRLSRKQWRVVMTDALYHALLGKR